MRSGNPPAPEPAVRKGERPTSIVLKVPPISAADRRRLKALADWERDSELSLLGYRARN